MFAASPRIVALSSHLSWPCVLITLQLSHTKSKGSNCSAATSVSISGSSACHTSCARSAMA